MCTVSYVPLKNGYILTSNRDENPDRKTKLPSKMQLNNGEIIYSPIDVLKGGSWIATDEQGRTACLLNGAFLKHKPNPTYRKSRGQIVLDSFEANDFKNYALTVILENIEPFTLLLIEPDHIQKLVWDGTKKHISDLPTKTPYLWSSATLYTADEHAKKENYFLEELKGKDSNVDLMLHIHGKNEITPFIFSHSTVQTVSITQVICNERQTSLNYILKNNTNETTDSLSLNCSSLLGQVTEHNK
ncbi:NRDE family protein [Formosa sp. PL04]|uniref:NRDE family protein n=1 Tax=Formosa sp. PL04 TaxID=3081755 RepID=UPI0029822B6B|nr:NRDE family protein [Formosa sp. PL04]MDW5290167.1 NRDE family protein [Formosa sp. PL04]